MRVGMRSPLTIALPNATIALLACMAIGAPPAVAADRKVRAAIHNVASSPVELREAMVELIEVFASPTQRSTTEEAARWSRVEYANRKGLLPSKLILRTEAVVINRSPHTIEAVALTAMPLNAFHQTLEMPGQPQYAIHQVEESLARGASRRVTWEQPVVSTDVYAVLLMATAARFADSSVWMAPRQIIQDLFFPSSRR